MPRASDEAISQAFYKAKALSGGVKIASFGEDNASHTFGEATSQAFYKAKALSGGTRTSSGEANAPNAFGEAKLALSEAKQAALIKHNPATKAVKSFSRSCSTQGVALKSLWVSVLDRLGAINSDLRDYLSNKRKLHFEEPINISPSQCEHARCQL